jgi:hypothetical protein
MTSVLIRILLAMPGTANDLPPAHALSDVHRIYVDSIYFRPPAVVPDWLNSDSNASVRSQV